MTTESEFLYPHSHFHGELTPENIEFHNKMEDFVQRSSILSNLASNGKISLEQAFTEIGDLWEELCQKKEQLNIGTSSDVSKNEPSEKQERS
ncbi:hypothetical protein JJD41_16570 [Oxynema sp. CENA135]|uniref:DUF7219 family protein n=1 Tax=Oxynema sp. CENA135 TaxID=984206 RepID=UPI001909FADF|nr:hypothetical protein [Oxynema sp. CENA135]MBK4731465.1 hypothetical protein [Oxynema sp. CENA135]